MGKCSRDLLKLLKAIDARDAAGFGIRKLSVLDVNGLHEARSFVTSRRPPFAVRSKTVRRHRNALHGKSVWN